MEIPNYDCKDDSIKNDKQLHKFMPDRCFRMLICGPVGSGKTNVLLHMIYRLLYYDKIFLYAINLEQSKYPHFLKPFPPISDEVGYPIIEASKDPIMQVSELDDDNQKMMPFYLVT